MGREKVPIALFILLMDLNSFIIDNSIQLWQLNAPAKHTASLFQSSVLLVEAKGVAGLGKAGGDGQGGSDKAGQQVPPEVYIALTYAGTAFLFTLSVPLILYGLNKLLNKIEDCFGCGPSSKRLKQQQQLKSGNQNHSRDPLSNHQSSSEKQEHFSAANQQFHHQQQMQYKFSKYHPQSIMFDSSASNASDAGTMNNNCQAIAGQQQQQHQHNTATRMQSANVGSPPKSCAINLANFDPHINYKTPSPGIGVQTPATTTPANSMTQQHHQGFHHQPYIISSEHI